MVLECFERPGSTLENQGKLKEATHSWESSSVSPQPSVIFSSRMLCRRCQSRAGPASTGPSPSIFLRRWWPIVTSPFPLSIESRSTTLALSTSCSSCCSSTSSAGSGRANSMPCTVSLQVDTIVFATTTIFHTYWKTPWKSRATAWVCTNTSFALLHCLLLALFAKAQFLK